MLPHKLMMATASLLISCACLAQTTEQPRYTMKQSEPSTGTAILRVLVESSLPLDRSYDQLTAEQKVRLRSMYVNMKQEDDPPFPLEGLGKLYGPIQKGTKKWPVRGQLSLFVRVSASGEAVSAEVLETPDAEFGRFAASIALVTRFKPAMCSGQPCVMDFPVRLNFTRRY